MDTIVKSPCIPYVGPISEFSPRKLIQILGSMSEFSHQFTVNLHCGSNASTEMDDVALQICVRNLDGYISLNSFRNLRWDTPIHLSSEIFRQAEEFEIGVLCGTDHYKVTINGRLLCDFPQIISFERISYLSVTGDVQISKISMKSSSSNISCGFEIPNAILTQSETESASSTTLLLPPVNQPQSLTHHHLSPPPSYNQAVSSGNDTELKPYPVQPNHAAYVEAFTTQAMLVPNDIVSPQQLPENSSKSKKICAGVGGVVGVVFIVFIKILLYCAKSAARQDTYSSYYSNN